MTKRMLIDATHPEETRVVVVDGTKLEEFDFETTNKRQLKGNIYLAKVTRVEPSLQAAFVEYGGDRHGFLAFTEIHPDYYQIPVSDREALLKQQRQDEIDAEAPAAVDGEGGDEVETVSGVEEDEIRVRSAVLPRYRIQEVIKRRQILLVQVTKEERGNKGAALTTYISLAGRYCVLMPNTTRGGGISRKIQSGEVRKRLRSVIASLEVSDGMAVILRTAGQERTKAEIRRDYDYLLKLWEHIRETTLESSAPALIHEEANLIRRSIRDLYSSQIEEVLVEGEEGYRVAKDFIRTLMPSHAKRVQRYRERLPLFTRYQVDSQFDTMHSASVQLHSGGYIVINSTEALVAIDVNSGRATRERNIEETATVTNLEAAEEIARQLRLRDLAGLIVIDFIDMDEGRNIRAVEKRLKEAVQSDRARIRMGRISSFGLLELSRQRLRPSLLEVSSIDCPHCGGSGHVRSVESSALHALRVIEEEGGRGRSAAIQATMPSPVALYLLNHKREALAQIEASHGMTVTIEPDDSPAPPNCVVQPLAAAAEKRPVARVEAVAETTEEAPPAEEPRRRRGRQRGEEKAAAVVEESGEATAEATRPESGEETGEGGKRRRRGRRGGRRRSRARGAEETPSTGAEVAEPVAEEVVAEEVVAEEVVAEEVVAETAAAVEGEAEIVKPKRRRRTRKRKSATETQAEAGSEPQTAPEPGPEPAPPAERDEAAPDNGAGEAPVGAADDESAATRPAPDDSDEPRRGWWQRIAGV